MVSFFFIRRTFGSFVVRLAAPIPDAGEGIWRRPGHLPRPAPFAFERSNACIYFRIYEELGMIVKRRGENGSERTLNYDKNESDAEGKTAMQGH